MVVAEGHSALTVVLGSFTGRPPPSVLQLHSGEYKGVHVDSQLDAVGDPKELMASASLGFSS